MRGRNRGERESGWQGVEIGGARADRSDGKDWQRIEGRSRDGRGRGWRGGRSGLGGKGNITRGRNLTRNIGLCGDKQGRNMRPYDRNKESRQGTLAELRMEKWKGK